jgi:thioredoxin 1
VNIGKLNSDENPQVSVKYGVMNLPCVLFFKNGEVVDKQVGLAAKSVYEKKIQQHM